MERGMGAESGVDGGEQQGDLLLAVVTGRTLQGSPVRLADLARARASDGRIRVIVRGAGADAVHDRIEQHAPTETKRVDESALAELGDDESDDSAAVLVADPPEATERGIRVRVSIVSVVDGREIALESVTAEYSAQSPRQLIAGPTTSAS